MAELRFTVLGCGSSGGVPRLGGHWGDCDPEDPRNRRSRCSLLVERETSGGTTRILIDTSPDMRQQLLAAGIGVLDGVVYTHAHADHVHGLDDLRQVVFNTRTRLQVWADGDTADQLLSRFGYAFVQPKGSPYPPILELNTIRDQKAFSIDGPGGVIDLLPFRVNHGSIDSLGFRIGDVAYLPDVAEMNDFAWGAVEKLDCWILDALRRTPHPTHVHLDLALEWIDRAKPRHAVLTNMHIDLDYAKVEAETPAHVKPAHDGLVLRYEI